MVPADAQLWRRRSLRASPLRLSPNLHPHNRLLAGLPGRARGVLVAHRAGRLARQRGIPPRDLFYSVRRPIVALSPDLAPKINGNDTFVAPSAHVIGDVFVGEGSSVWYGAVVRGDSSRVFIGAKCSVGDKVVINTTATGSRPEDLQEGGATPLPSVVTLGNYVTIGAGSIIAGDFTAGNAVRIEEGVTIDEGVVIGDGASVESGSVIPSGTYIPAGETWGGSPLQKTGVSSEESNTQYAQQIEVIRDDHIHEFLPFGDAHLHLEELEGGN